VSITVQAREHSVSAVYVQPGAAAVRVERSSAPPSVVYWLVPVIVLLLLETLSRTGVMPSNVLPAPSQVVKVAWDLTRSGELPTNLLVSLSRVAVGLAIGGTLGLALGFIVGLSGWAAALFDGSLQMLRTIPHLALIPLVILWFGIGEEAKYFLVALGTFFPLYLNTVHGIRSVDPKLVEMGRSYGLDRLALIREVVLPGALSGILVGVRYSLGIAWLSLVVGETIAASSGIGFMAMDAREFMRTDVILLSIVIYAAFGGLADLVARLLERRFLRWHPNYVQARTR
jgi:sulfonate transport system permease protein